MSTAGLDGAKDKEGDEISLSSMGSLSLSQRFTQDCIELKIYGIEEVGKLFSQ